MDELESQIAKISLGNTKSSSSYIYVMAEKSPSGSEELYVVAELPLFNPAAQESCERICLAIASGLRRAYKRPGNENTFENAINQINEELGKLASMGQTQWIDKLNCILGVKSGRNFTIATCGKISAYLLRNREYTDISCSSPKSHPLKTFENYATGKIRLGDLLLLSTIQLFNYLSMDRLMKIVSNADFLTSTQTVIQLLKETSDPQISFGVLLNLQVPPGETAETEVDLENYIVENVAPEKNILAKGLAYLKTAFALDKPTRRIPTVALPKISLGERISKLNSQAKNLAARGKNWWQSAKTFARTSKEKVNAENLRQLNPVKKFFLASVILLAIATTFSIIVAVHTKNTRQNHDQISNRLKETQNLLSSAQSSLLYKNDADAWKFLDQAKNTLPNPESVDSANKEFYSKVLAQLNDINVLMEKVVTPEVTNLGSLGQAENLIKLPNHLAISANQVIVSYNKQNGKIEDSALKLPLAILSSIYINGNITAVYDGTKLYLWDFSKGTVGPGFSQSVPQKNDFAGLAQYATNNRVYLVDKKSGSIINFLAGTNGFSRPVVSVTDPSLSQAIDVTVDGSIYVLGNGVITKFQSGKLANFATPKLSQPISGTGKIYTNKDLAYLYLLDSGNNRILILGKDGSLVMALKSSDFTKLKDFQVDEKNSVIYVLNDSSLLKVALP